MPGNMRTYCVLSSAGRGGCKADEDMAPAAKEPPALQEKEKLWTNGYATESALNAGLGIREGRDTSVQGKGRWGAAALIFPDL